MPLVKTWQLIAVSAVAGLALSAATVAAAGPWDSGQRKAERDKAASWGRTGGADHGTDPAAQLPRAAPSAPGVLAGVRPAGAGSGDQAGAADPGALAAALRPLLADPALGTARGACVIDTATGQVLYEAGARQAMTPASTIKIATAAASLAALGPEHRIRTTVTPGAGPGRIILVGGGDPSLTAKKKAPAGSGGSLVALAADTAQALKASGTDSVALGYDDSLYTGPVRHPIGENPNLAPVTALTADEGRPDESFSGPVKRSTDPSRDTARAFAALLGNAGSRSPASPPGPRPPRGPSRSPPPSRPRSPGWSSGC